VLEQNGLSFDDVFICLVMLGDMSKWRAFSAAYVPYFKKERLPARRAFGANGLALGARGMEVWAWTGKRLKAGQEYRRCDLAKNYRCNGLKRQYQVAKHAPARNTIESTIDTKISAVAMFDT
jgi:enamine deaminase RidA (YjgF/YER057c/UK114 family)